jgi:hypothetical protein
VTPTLTFTCSICGEPSREICNYCTKDACSNHICDKCQRCSDCCECEVHLDERPQPVRPSVYVEQPHTEEPVIDDRVDEEPQPEEVEAAIAGLEQAAVVPVDPGTLDPAVVEPPPPHDPAPQAPPQDEA